MNKDLVLREHLAIVRTQLSNETTLLSYIRTGLYFIVAGSTLGPLMETTFWHIVSIPLILIGVIIIILGAIRFTKIRKRIEASRANVGQSSEAFLQSVIKGE